MSTRMVWRTALALGVMAAAPTLVAAQQTVYGGATWGTTSCSGATLTPCVEFTLEYDDVNDLYYFSTTYVGSTASDPGVMTATGLYDPNKQQEPSFTFTDVTVISPSGWNTEDCEHLSGDGPVLFEACADADGGVTNGIAPGQTVVFAFGYGGTRDLFADLANGDLGARAHIQSFGSADCSLKPDSRVGVVSGPEGGLESCNGQVIPEPMTVILLGMGLLGVGAVTVKNRKDPA